MNQTKISVKDILGLKGKRKITMLTVMIIRWLH